MRCYSPFLVLLIVMTSAMQLHARIGESRASIDGRLLHERRAATLPDKLLKERLAATRVPYINLLKYLPVDSVEHVIYFKKARSAPVLRSELDQRRLPDGWELHVVYFSGVSVFEAYRRVGGSNVSISDPEMNGLLVINQEGSHWREITEREKRDLKDVFHVRGSEERPRPAFILDNDTILASRMSDAIMVFYRPELGLIIRQKKEEELDGIREEQQRDSAQSLHGF